MSFVTGPKVPANFLRVAGIPTVLRQHAGYINNEKLAHVTYHLFPVSPQRWRRIQEDLCRTIWESYGRTPEIKRMATLVTKIDIAERDGLEAIVIYNDIIKYRQDGLRCQKTNYGKARIEIINQVRN